MARWRRWNRSTRSSSAISRLSAARAGGRIVTLYHARAGGEPGRRLTRGAGTGQDAHAMTSGGRDSTIGRCRRSHGRPPGVRRAQPPDEVAAGAPRRRRLPRSTTACRRSSSTTSSCVDQRAGDERHHPPRRSADRLDVVRVEVEASDVVVIAVSNIGPAAAIPPIDRLAAGAPAGRCPAAASASSGACVTRCRSSRTATAPSSRCRRRPARRRSSTMTELAATTNGDGAVAAIGVISVAVINDYEVVVRGRRRDAGALRRPRPAWSSWTPAATPTCPADIALFDTFAGRRHTLARAAEMVRAGHGPPRRAVHLGRRARSSSQAAQEIGVVRRGAEDPLGRRARRLPRAHRRRARRSASRTATTPDRRAASSSCPTGSPRCWP